MPLCSSRTRRLLTFFLVLISLCVSAMIAVVVSAANPAGAPAPMFAPLVAPPNCTPPGVQVISDPAGDQTGAPLTNQQLDARAVSIAEQYADYSTPGKLIITMKVQTLDPANLPPNSTWQTNFDVKFPDNSTTTYFVTAANNSANNPTGISFNFGFHDVATDIDTTTEAADAASSLNAATATLKVVISLDKIKKPVAGTGQSTLTGPVADLSAGKTITNVNLTTSTLIGAVGNGISATIDTTSSAPYTFVGVIACNGAPTPTPTPTATPTATPTPTPSGAPRFHNFAAPNGMGSGAGEPSIGVNWETGRAMYIANLRTLRITFDDCFSPAKALWEDKSASNTSVRTLDPILFTDHMRAPGDTTPNRTIVSQLSGTTSLSSYTDDDGETWIPNEGGSGTAGVDHQTVGGGPFHAPLPGGVTYPNAMYYCGQEGLIVSGSGTANCALSVDGGRTYGPSVPVYTVGDLCAPLHGHIKVAPDGTAYLPNQGCGSKKEASVIVSKDNGITWDVKSVPGSSATGYLVDPSVSIGSDGTVYLGYQAKDRTPRIAVSTNQGDTWINDQNVGALAGVTNSTFPEVVAGDGDRAAFAFLGSTTPGDYTQESYPGVWHLYVATTFNRGATWTVTNATPNDPVQRGSICNLGTTPCAMPPVGPRTKDDRNLLDFMDATVDKEGRTLVAYPDGCITSACIGGGANDFTAKATIARQAGGKRLFAAYDPPNPAPPGSPLATAARNNNGVHIAWAQPDNGGAPITNYRVYRRAEGQATRSMLADVGTALSYDDATGVAGTNYFYSVSAFNSAGESQNCPNSEVSAGSASNPCVLPGVSLVTDATGDTNPPAQPDLDILEAFVAEPYAAGQPDKLVWTMKLANLTTIVPNRQWYIIWTPSSGLRKYVAAKSDATGALSYEYGEVGSTSVGDPNLNKPMPLGAADAGSVDVAKGTISITIANSKVGGPSAGTTLLDISPRSFAGGGNLNVISTSAADLTTITPAYTLVGNSSCILNQLPNALLSAAPLQGAAPLVVNFDASGSTDPDAGDSITSYTFDFGDGQTTTQSSPTVSHTYTSKGNYRALLTVQDSRGGQSANVAQAFISALDATDRINHALAANGGTALGSSEYPGGGFPAASAINGDRSGANWGSNSGGWNDGTRDAYPDSLEISFNGTKTIDEIRVYTLQDSYSGGVEPTEAMTCTTNGIEDFVVQYYDGTQWVTVQSVVGNDHVIRTFSFAPVAATKVRVVVSKSRNHYSRVVELEAYGAP